MIRLPLRCIAEGIGTFAIVFFGCGSIIVLSEAQKAESPVAINLVFGLIVSAMIYCFGHVSGAHFNPAVTLGLASGGRFSWKETLPYVVSQVAGAILASILHLLFLGATARASVFGATSSHLEPVATALFEAVLTFFLVLVIVATATDTRAPNGFAGLAIGFTVLVSGLFAGPITGNSLNPARSLGPALLAGQTGSVWPYVLGPTIGAIIAVQIYQLFRAPDPNSSGPKASSLETNPGTNLRSTETVSK